jgi:hypothetical protein
MPNAFGDLSEKIYYKEPPLLFVDGAGNRCSDELEIRYIARPWATLAVLLTRSSIWTYVEILGGQYGLLSIETQIEYNAWL